MARKKLRIVFKIWVLNSKVKKYFCFPTYFNKKIRQIAPADFSFLVWGLKFLNFASMLLGMAVVVDTHEKELRVESGKWRVVLS